MLPGVELVGPGRHHEAEPGRHADRVVDGGVAIDDGLAVLGDGDQGVGRVAVELGRLVDDEDQPLCARFTSPGRPRLPATASREAVYSAGPGAGAPSRVRSTAR